MARCLTMLMAASLSLPALVQGQTTGKLDDQEVRNRLSDLLRDSFQPSGQFAATPRRGEEPPVLQWLNHVPKEPIDWEDKPFNEIIEWLSDREETGAPVDMNVVVKTVVLEDAGVDTEYEVTLKVHGLTLRKILTLVLEKVGGADPATKMGFHATDDLLTISTVEDLNGQMFVKTYDVTDVVLNVPDFTEAPTMDVSQLQERQGQSSRGGGGGQTSGQLFQSRGGEDEGAEESRRTFRMERLIELITTTIQPESWQANGGEGTIGFNGSVLLVFNTLEVHQMIEEEVIGGVRMR